MRTTLTLLALVVSASAWATEPVSGPMAFVPLAASAYGQGNSADIATAPWVLPQGFEQHLVVDERTLNLYLGNDWPDMNSVNETGPEAGRYLYRTHEVRGGAPGDDGNARRVDGGSGGAVSVVDLNTGKARELVTRSDWEALDGLRWTPWQTLLFAEEVKASLRPDPQVPHASSGLVYELHLVKGEPMRAARVEVRPLLGALAHEGIELDEQGRVYVIDEDKSGAIYRFVPETPGDLSQGRLYALKVDGGQKTGLGEWVALDMTQAQISARVAAAAVGATPYCRPEDVERIGSTLYVALTCEDVDDPANHQGAGAVLAVALQEQAGRPVVRYAVAPGKNVAVEIKGSQTGMKNPDNLAEGPDGKLWIVEDNDYSDIWVYDPASPDANGDGYRDGVALFASLKDKTAEGTGIYFGKDPHTLFVNVQHSGTGNDKTLMLRKR